MSNGLQNGSVVNEKSLELGVRPALEIRVAMLS